MCPSWIEKSYFFSHRAHYRHSKRRTNDWLGKSPLERMETSGQQVTWSSIKIYNASTAIFSSSALLGSIFQNALKLLQYRNQKEYQHLRHYNFIFTENTRIYLKDINLSKKSKKIKDINFTLFNNNKSLGFTNLCKY